MAMLRQRFNRAVALVFSLSLGWGQVWAAAPSRSRTYVTGQIIEPGDVTTNEDGIFSYLQAGVDTYAIGSVNAAAIADDAVGAAEIAAGAVGASEIASGAVDAGDMATTGTIADDKAFIADSGTAGTWRTITNCTDTGGNHLNYTQSTNSFSCGTTGDGTGTDVGGTNADVIKRTAGDVTTTSTSLVDFTGASITKTTAANPAVMGFAGDCTTSDATQTVVMAMDVDGTTETQLAFDQGVASERVNCSFTIMTADLTAASHTFKFRWYVTGGTGTVNCDATDTCFFWVTEVVD